MGLFGKLFGPKQPAPRCAIHPSDETLVRGEGVTWWNNLPLWIPAIHAETTAIRLYLQSHEFKGNPSTLKKTDEAQQPRNPHSPATGHAGQFRQ